MIAKIRLVLSYGRSKWWFLVSSLAYFILFLFAIGNIVFSEIEIAPGFDVLPYWSDNFFKQIAPFYFESIASWHPFSGFAILISPMNILLGIILSVLLGLNAAVLVFSLAKPKVCRVKSYWGILGSLPSLLLGFACCVPLIVPLLGATIAAAVALPLIQLRGFFFPLSLVLLLASLWWSLRRMFLPRV